MTEPILQNVDPTLLLVLTACLYILVFGGLSLLRREGLPVQLAVEAIVVTALLAGLGWLLRLQVSPILLVIVLYLVTMRSRLLVDLANVLARRKNYPAAFRLYGLALSLWPDPSSRLIVLTNRGAAEIFAGKTKDGIATLEGVLRPENGRFLGRRYEAACRYNLGYAHELQGETAQAVEQYNAVLEVLPGSMYAHAAQAALKRRQKGEGR